MNLVKKFVVLLLGLFLSISLFAQPNVEDLNRDLDPPEVTNMDPADGQSNVPLDVHITFRLEDSDSVDLSSIQVAVTSLDGTTNYDVDNSNLFYSGEPNNYYIVITPPMNLDMERQ